MPGELPDLRLAALLGFGRYDRVALSAPAANPTQNVIEVPAVGGGKSFILIGYLGITDCPPDLVAYQIDFDSSNSTQYVVCESMRTPLLLLLSPEKPRAVINVQQRVWASNYTIGIGAYVDTLTGQVEQLKQLYKWLTMQQAPASLTEQVFAGVESLAGLATGDWY